MYLLCLFLEAETRLCGWMWLVRFQNNGSHTQHRSRVTQTASSHLSGICLHVLSLSTEATQAPISALLQVCASTSEHCQPQWALVIGDVGGRSDHVLLSKQLENPAYILVFSQVYLSGCRIVSHLPTNPYHPLWLLSPHSESSSQREFQMPFSSIMERTSHCTSNCLPNLHTQTYSRCCSKLSSLGNRFQLLRKAFW